MNWPLVPIPGDGFVFPGRRVEDRSKRAQELGSFFPGGSTTRPQRVRSSRLNSSGLPLVAGPSGCVPKVGALSKNSSNGVTASSEPCTTDSRHPGDSSDSIGGVSTWPLAPPSKSGIPDRRGPILTPPSGSTLSEPVGVAPSARPGGMDPRLLWDHQSPYLARNLGERRRMSWARSNSSSHSAVASRVASSEGGTRPVGQAGPSCSAARRR